MSCLSLGQESILQIQNPALFFDAVFVVVRMPQETEARLRSSAPLHPQLSRKPPHERTGDRRDVCVLLELNPPIAPVVNACFLFHRDLCCFRNAPTATKQSTKWRRVGTDTFFWPHCRHPTQYIAPTFGRPPASSASSRCFTTPRGPPRCP